MEHIEGAVYVVVNGPSEDLLVLAKEAVVDIARNDRRQYNGFEIRISILPSKIEMA